MSVLDTIFADNRALSSAPFRGGALRFAAPLLIEGTPIVAPSRILSVVNSQFNVCSTREMKWPIIRIGTFAAVQTKSLSALTPTQSERLHAMCPNAVVCGVTQNARGVRLLVRSILAGTHRCILPKGHEEEVSE